MVGKNYTSFGLILLTVGWLALQAGDQPAFLIPQFTVTPPETKLKNQRAAAASTLIQRRRARCEKQVPNDNASRLLGKMLSGEVKLDNSDLRSLTESLLVALDVPISSQLLVFSGSASQGLKVNPNNPRAIYFNDEVYVGIVPGGLLEMIGVDPNIGAVLYTFRDVGTGRLPSTTGGSECMRCHSRTESGYAQGFFVRSTIPNESGLMVGSQDLGAEGHDRPLGRRFGGWFITSGQPDIFGKAGLVAQTEGSNSRTVLGYKTTRPGQLYNSKIHLAESSDILANLLHEHQIGFHNRVARVLMSVEDDGLQNGERVLTTHAQDIADLVSYMLFRNEAALPEEGIVGDPRFIEDFRRNRRVSRSGSALKDLDLNTRLFKHRCTYMIYTRPWLEMPAKVKGEIYAKMRSALMGHDLCGFHLSDTEKQEIVQILTETLPDLPSDWK